MKKLLALLLTLCLIFGLAACGGTTDSSAPTSAVSVEAASEAPETEVSAEASVSEPVASVPEEVPEAVAAPVPVTLPIVDEPVTYTIWYNEPFTEYIDNPAEDVAIFRLLAEKTNISLDFHLTTIDAASDQFQLLFAADSLPNIITDAMDYYAGSIDDAVFEDEFLYNYADDLTDMTNYNAALNQYIEAKKTITSADSGAMVSFPELYKDVGDEDGYMIRKDYLDLTGMDVPTTYDEMHDVLAAIHEKNGSGLDLTSSGGDALLGAGFGINCGLDSSDLAGWYVVDNEVRMGILQPEFRDYLEMVKQWYSEGIIYADFINSDNGDLTNLFTGAVSITMKVPEIIDVAAAVVGAEMIPMKAPVKQAGDTITICGGESSCLMDPHTWSINVQTENIDPLLKMIDYMYSPEATDMMNYGEEGVSFEYDTEGNPQFTALVLDNPDDYDYAHAAYFYATSNRTRLPFVSDYARCFSDYSEAAMEAVDIYTDDCTHENDYPNGAIMNTEQTQQYNTVAADICTYISEHVLQFIYGQEDMAQWDSFIDTLYEMGIETAIEAKQAAYEDYLNT